MRVCVLVCFQERMTERKREGDGKMLRYTDGLLKLIEKHVFAAAEVFYKQA